MARIHSISTLAFLFILVAQMLSTEGRDIKPQTMKIAPQKTSTYFSQTVTHTNNLPSLKPTRKIPKSSLREDSMHVNKVESADLDKKDSDKPNKDFASRLPTSSSFFSASVLANKNDYRPTVPGISPGAGHPGTDKNEKEESGHCLSDKCTKDFRPTVPGESPGAGHSFVNSNDSKTPEQGTHLNVAYTQAGQTDDYRPTAPGHSPGAGHPVRQETKKPYS